MDLTKLKVGDKVAVDTGWGRTYWEIHKIIKITPSGMIDTENGWRFRNGRFNVDKWTSYYLSEVTEKIIEEVEKRKLIENFKKIIPEGLSIKQLKELNEITNSKSSE